MDIPSHIDRMAETPRRHLEVTVVARDDSWEWQVQSEDTVLISGTGRTRLLARFLGNDARLRLLAEDFGDLRDTRAQGISGAAREAASAVRR
jgi:hypothetical protein